jgi:putative two-component system response regulator
VGDQIPLSARLMAVADVYDALISRRPYKEPMTHEMARAYIVSNSGAHFDPEIVQAFLALQPLFIDIANTWHD